MLAKAHDIGSTDNQEGQGHPVIRTLYDHLEEVTCLEFHPNKPILASGSRDCHVKLFDYSKTSVKKAFKTINVRHVFYSEKHTFKFCNSTIRDIFINKHLI